MKDGIMKLQNIRFGALTALACLLTAGCTETRFEEASGEGSVRGINAIVELNDVTFRIEEFGLGVVPFKGSSATASYDNLNYTFNFDLPVPGEVTPRRLASRNIDVVDQQDYTFVLTGDVTNQQVLLWERAIRDWSGSETVFDINVAHLNTTLGAVDVYLVPDGQVVDPTTLAGTVSFGERLDAVEREAGDYQVIVTTENQPGDILFQSIALSVLPAQSYTVAVFDADPSITAPASARLFDQGGTSIEVPDERFSGTLQVVHAVQGVGNIDVAIDGDFTNLAITDLAFATVSADVDAPSDVTPFAYVPTGNTMALFEEDRTVPLGARDMAILLGPSDGLFTLTVASLRRGFATAAQIRVINTVTNFELVDIYIYEPGTDINEVGPTIFGVPFGFTQLSTSEPGDFEITITAVTEKTPLKTPEIITLSANDIIEFIVLDDVDPNAVQTLSFSNINP